MGKIHIVDYFEEGIYEFKIIVRDGHGLISYCAINVVVESTDNDSPNLLVIILFVVILIIILTT